MLRISTRCLMWSSVLSWIFDRQKVGKTWYWEGTDPLQKGKGPDWGPHPPNWICKTHDLHITLEVTTKCLRGSLPKFKKKLFEWYNIVIHKLSERPVSKEGGPPRFFGEYDSRTYSSLSSAALCDGYVTYLSSPGGTNWFFQGIWGITEMNSAKTKRRSGGERLEYGNCDISLE
jgi:hypothetical protein